MTSGPYAGYTNYHSYLSLYNGKLPLLVPALESYLVTVEVEGLGTATVDGATSKRVSRNTTCSLVAIPADRQRFVGWYIDGTLLSTDPTYTYTPTKNVTIVAKFELNQFEIKVSNGDTANLISAVKSPDGTLEPGNPDLYLGGTTITFTATPRERDNTYAYVFDHWEINSTEVSRDNPYVATVGSGALNKPCTVVAKGKKISLGKYYIIYNPWECDGKIENTTTGEKCDETQVGIRSVKGIPGDRLKLYANPDSNYKFVRWDRRRDDDDS